MQDKQPVYIYEEEPITPIEDSPDPTVAEIAADLKPKVYQFRSTVRAWKSKYKRHVGAKQWRKELLTTFKSYSDEQLIQVLNHIRGTADPQESHERDIWLAAIQLTFKQRNLPIPDETLPSPDPVAAECDSAPATPAIS